MSEAFIVAIGLIGALVIYQHIVRRKARQALEAREKEHALIIRWLQLRISHLERSIMQLIEHGNIDENMRAHLTRERDTELNLYHVLKSQFTLSELESLAFECGLKWDNITGATLDTRAISFIQLMSEQGKLAYLMSAIRKARPSSGL